MNKWIVGGTWTAVTLLALIGIAAASHRAILLIPTVTRGYLPEATPTFPKALDLRFAQHGWLTLAHILPGMLFMILGPLQFIPGIRARHLQFHRWSGRVFVASGLLIGASAL